MSTKKALSRVGIALSVAAVVGLVGWVVGCGGGEGVTTTPDQPSAYTLTTATEPAAGGNIVRSLDQSLYVAGTEVTLTANANPGYDFIGWEGASSSKEASITVTMNSALSLTAKFQPQGPGGGDTTGTPPATTRYTLTTPADPAAGGSVKRSLDLPRYIPGTEVTLTAVANAGYQFAGWEGASTSKETSITVTMDKDLSITAKFLQVTSYTLTTTADPTAGGSVQRSLNQSNYEAGTKVTLMAVANTGYEFIGWSGASTSKDASITVTMNSDLSLTAKFQPIPTYTLITSTDPTVGGNIKRSLNESHYAAGTKVTLTAEANEGYAFTGWEGAMSSKEPSITVTMNSSISITAKFQPIIVPKVTINGLTWMKENLNIETTDSWCYGNSPDSCAKYGRLYTWEAAKTACASLGGGWRLPDSADWRALVTYAGGQNTAGKKLKANSGWRDRIDGTSGNGTDDYGFSALPGGYRNTDGSFNHAGNNGYWWSATESGGGEAYDRSMNYSIDFVLEYTYDVRYGFSARCVED